MSISTELDLELVSKFHRWGLTTSLNVKPLQIVLWISLGIGTILNLLDLGIRIYKKEKRWMFRRQGKDGVPVVNVFAAFSVASLITLGIAIFTTTQLSIWFTVDAAGSDFKNGPIFVMVFWVPVVYGIALISTSLHVAEILATSSNRENYAKLVLVIGHSIYIIWDIAFFCLSLQFNTLSNEGFKLSRNIQLQLSDPNSTMSAVEFDLLFEQLDQIAVKALSSARRVGWIAIIAISFAGLSIVAIVIKRSIRFYRLFYSQEKFNWKLLLAHRKQLIPVELLLMMVPAPLLIIFSSLLAFRPELLIPNINNILIFGYGVLCCLITIGSILLNIVWITTHIKETIPQISDILTLVDSAREIGAGKA